MKKLLLLILLLFPFIILAQDAAEPFKNADLIIVESELKSVEALKQVALLMQERGYIIQRYDPELLSLVANKTSAEPSNALFRIQVYIKETPGTRLQFSGDYRFGSKDGDVFGVIQYYTGVFHKLNNVIFLEMEKLAKAVPGSRMYYSKL